MISIKLFTLQEFPMLKDDWKKIENGADMTAFQTYSWYELICNQYSHKGNLIPGKVVFAAAYDDKAIKMIAPLFIITLPSAIQKFNIDNGAHILGKWGYTDYLNFIYDDFSEKCFEMITKTIKENFKIRNLNIHQLLPETSLHRYLDKYYSNSLLFEGDCAHIPVQENFDCYYKLLSKNVRQNLRTAQNRADKDNIDIHYEIHHRLSKHDAEEFYNIYCERQYIKNSESNENLIAKISGKYSSYKKSKFNFLTQAMTSLDNGFVLGCYSGTQKIGLCYGVEDENGIRIPIVCFKQDFSRYSPCMLCIYNYIKDSYENGTIKTFDLLKGNEPYKFNLGGEKFSIGYYKIYL